MWYFSLSVSALFFLSSTANFISPELRSTTISDSSTEVWDFLTWMKSSIMITKRTERNIQKSLEPHVVDSTVDSSQLSSQHKVGLSSVVFLFPGSKFLSSELFESPCPVE
jgi:hypothetical protein